MNEPLKTEQLAVDAMLERGVSVPVETRGIIRLVGIKQINFVLRQPYLGTLMQISRQYLEIRIDENQIKDDAFRGSYMLVPANAKRVSRIIATAILNDKIKIALFRDVLARWLIWRLNPATLFEMMMAVVTICNTASFTNSIRLIEVARVTKPRKESKDENLSRDSTGV